MDIYQLNEQHHRDRAEYWLKNDRQDYAEGSLKKAAKWQARRREFEYAINGAYPKTEIDELIDRYVHDCTEKVVNDLAARMFYYL